MKQEDKKLLLKDLCARLPYGVKVNYNEEVCTIDSIGNDSELLLKNNDGEIVPKWGDSLFISIEKCKPYLFPLSSMTEEQLNDFYATIRPVIEEALDAYKDDKTEYKGERPITLKDIKTDIVAVNWMLKNHFDMNGLIPKGLAIDATGLNIY